ncbi:ROK family transcriptional regulator [Salinibacterium sp. G-O1]|uniref:ROK family transcriptional regulator n=1 Tax=Salinibacterium sp. G-O1 TaxID=3046208 RepID=UPI0024BB6A71|nr:ROK family transcriptional regulator [Salinibacterium sp. G-O1]MDJ0336399.1 ROK family transcriptional regulator [Salinibacterium sp. G-O1]
MSNLPFLGLAASARQAGGTPVDLGRANAASVLGAILAEGPLARAEIADRVGLTRATVTRVTNRLIELGIVREGEPRRENPGRPLIPIELAGEGRSVITLHFGAHETRIGAVDLCGRVLAEWREPYRSPDPAVVVRDAIRKIVEMRSQMETTTRILGVAASVGGWVEPDSGVVVRFEPLGWAEVPLGSMLSDSLDLPLYFDQMVRGLALAERMFGAARGADDFVEMWIGNVVGAALVQDGSIRRGPRGAAGTIAHFPVRGGSDTRCECGRSGCLERSVSDEAVLAAAERDGLAHTTVLRDIVELAQADAPGARDLIARVARMAGEAGAAMADLVNPPLFVVAGLITTAPDYVNEFRRQFTRMAKLSELVEVRASEFGDLAPTIASASLLLDAYYRDPFGFEHVQV